VTLHGAGKALADGRAGDVNRLAFLEEVGLDLGPRFELGLVASVSRNSTSALPGATFARA